MVESEFSTKTSEAGSFEVIDRDKDEIAPLALELFGKIMQCP